MLKAQKELAKTSDASFSQQSSMSEDSGFERARKRKQIEESLKQHIPVEDLAQRQGGGGTQLTYIEGYEAIDRLNNIFGPLGWRSTMIEAPREVGNVVVVVVRVEIPEANTWHDDVGVGTGTDKEKAFKEAFTDALKRAARHFGNALGNSLYDKTHLRELDQQRRGATLQPPVRAGGVPLASRGVAPYPK